MWKIFEAADRFLAGLPRLAVIACALAAQALVGSVDYATSDEISFSVFYVVPIGVASWYTGLRSGMAFALCAAVLWYVAERFAGNQYHRPLILVWNAVVWFSFFSMTALLLRALRARLRAEQRNARTDSLTGVLNSLAFLEQLQRDLNLAGRTDTTLSLIYIDVDDFKVINDRYGHGEGDRVLRVIARVLSEGTRRTDSIGRLGGDEFALVLPNTVLDGASSLVCKLRQQLTACFVESARSVTCSFGVVEFRDRPHSADEAVALADRLMYGAKKRGKNAMVSELYVQSARMSS